jgi:hypothetical protein
VGGHARARARGAHGDAGVSVPAKSAVQLITSGNCEEVLDEWEKNLIKKVFRAEFDKDKQGIQSRDELKRLMLKLLNAQMMG